jgi:hypothetical protein
LGFIGATLEVEYAVLDPVVDAWRQRFSKRTRVDEDAEEDDVRDGEDAGESNNESECEHIDIAGMALGITTLTCTGRNLHEAT